MVCIVGVYRLVNDFVEEMRNYWRSPDIPRDHRNGTEQPWRL
jgi:hypothetical protein